jgi:hypothetical protein
VKAPVLGGGGRTAHGVASGFPPRVLDPRRRVPALAAAAAQASTVAAAVAKWD